MANAAYRRMLLKLGKSVRDDELHSMKFMCQDIIPGRRLEEISSPLDLWKALEERDHLGPDNTAFVRSLIANTTDGRTDVLRILSEYDSGALDLQPPLANCHIPPDMEKAFDIIVSEIGRDWRLLARKLGLSHTELEDCVEKHPRDLKEQIREALMKWVRNSDSSVTMSVLHKALLQCEQKLLSHLIEASE